jgi:peptidoglycan/xylan/chitin deacetylase (PgdA/CDA1 family)
MKALASGLRRVVPLHRVFDSPGSVAITFDDAFENFRRSALPVLKAHSLPATVFAVSGYVGKRNAWQQPFGIPDAPLMNWTGIRECSDAGIEIGCHTVSHPRLPDLTPEALDTELRESKNSIEQCTGRKVDTVAYPYGALNQMTRDCAAQYFTIGCGTKLAFVRDSDDRLRLPRLDVYYLRNTRRFTRFAQGAGALYIPMRAALRTFAAAVRPS